MMFPGDDNGDIILSDDEESEEGEEGDGHSDQKDNEIWENFLLPRFDFISLTGVPGLPDPYQSPTQEWENLFLADAPQYQSGEEYQKAKTCILEMESRDRPRIPRSLEIPIALKFSHFSATADQLAGYLKELGTLMLAMMYRAEALNSISDEVKSHTDSASMFIYRLIDLSMTFSHRDKMNHLLAERLCEILGSGVPVGELHMYLGDRSGGDADQAAFHEASRSCFPGC
ncbi:hypothetical protein GQ600_16370 [Phytophthora cactorum]|nr:hypothetical protein GQ600_16370 [Phytophthora cactorum]